MAEKTKLWYLQNFNMFDGMSPKMMMELAQNTSMQNNSKKVKWEVVQFL